MCNLLFLKVYNVGCHTGKSKLHIPEDIEFSRRIRLFHWDAYPGKSLPLRFFPANLIELNMEDSELQKLWEGTQLLANLKKLNLSRSSRFKELPNLSNATNLEELNLDFCKALVELPSSITNLHKLHRLLMHFCEGLEVIPTLINLASLRFIHITDTTLEEFPASLTHCSHLISIEIFSSANIKIFLIQLPTSVEHINLSNSGIERITNCIKGLYNLQSLVLSGCKRLASLPELPRSLEILRAENCESLERVNGHLNTPNAKLNFTNCFKLDREARRAIIQQSIVRGWAVLPGTKVPAEFDHRARGNSLTIPYSAFNKFKVCVVISPNHHQAREFDEFNFWSKVLVYRWTVIGNSVNSDEMKFYLKQKGVFNGNSVKLQKAHLFIFHSCLPINKVTKLEFSSEFQHFDIIECGVQILMEKTDESNNGGSGDKDSGCCLWDTDEFDESSDKEEENDDSAAKSESCEASYEEDGEEGYKSESGEAKNPY